MYTEEEAKTKQCVQAIVAPCVASRCMAWRWAQRETRMTGEDVAYVKVGYCGLAGKP
jgi:hypothetical protein